LQGFWVLVAADLNQPIYITTNYDKFMEAALKSRGKEPVSEFCRWNSYAQDLEISSVFEKNEEYVPSPEQPLVFHLHGIIDQPPTMVLTEDDYLDFLTSLSLKGSEAILPAIIRDVLSSYTLLFIGYSLEDISFRLLFRILTGLNIRRGLAIMPYPKNGEAAKYMEEYTRKMFP
jgi:hypothetical protein